MGRYLPSCLSKLLLAFLLLSSPVAVWGQNGAQNPDIDENFVIASLLISEPAGALYSRLGHAALHMQCPVHGLDYVFTYGAEDISERPLGFLSGKLRMGMVALDTQAYIDEHRKAGRGLKEYPLNLPIENKRELWRALDNHLKEGMDLKYDYLSRGCAYSTLMMLKEGLGTAGISYGAWPEHFKGSTRREVTWHHIHEDKWTTFFLHFIVNGVIDDRCCTNEKKAIIPADLPFILQNATVKGAPVIDSEPRQIVPSGGTLKTGWLTPMLVALLLLALTAICALSGSPVMDYVLLGMQTLLGVIAVWLVFFSSLVCTEWSWLLIPFNPLPLIFWKWRRHWALPYAVVLVAWAAFMLFWPHLLTDGAYVVTAMGLVLSYVSIYLKSKTIQYEQR